MKNKICLFLALTMLYSIPALGQTLEVEYDSMMNSYLTGRYTQLEYKDISITWRELIDSIGYPEVPYDSVNGKLEYEYFHTFEDIQRETIVNRISEWAAITFGITNSLVTQHQNASRLILNGSIEVYFPDLFMVYKNAWRGYVEKEQLNASTCFFTLVFTVRDGKMKSQVINLMYEYTDYISGRTISRSLDSCFPISSNEKDEWKAIMTLVNETSSSLKTMTELLENYIRKYEGDYTW